MRAPIEPGNPGWDPDAGYDRANKIGAGLRGAGFIVIVLAFLIVSQQFVTSDDEDPTTPGQALVYAAADLQPPLDDLDATTQVTMEYGASPALRQKVVDGTAVDVFVGLRDDTVALVEDGLCTDAAPVATEPAEYAACLVDRRGARTAEATKFLDALTGLDGRDALLQAGFEVPPR